MKWTPKTGQQFKWTVTRNGVNHDQYKKVQRYLPEFKAKVGLEGVRGVQIKEIAQDNGVRPVRVSQWEREIQDQAKTL